MRRTIFMAVGLVLAWTMAVSAGPPPVMLDLGQIQPTPEPTREPFQKMRLITTLTVRNTPDGSTIVMFEATDFGNEPDVGKEEDEEKEYKMLAAEQYTLTDETEEHVKQRDLVLERLRELEKALLDYVEAAGPPKEREPLFPSQQP